MEAKNIRLSDGDTAYVALPGYPLKTEAGVVSRTVALGAIIDGFKGPGINLDFDASGKLIGIEVLCPYPDDYTGGNPENGNSENTTGSILAG